MYNIIRLVQMYADFYDIRNPKPLLIYAISLIVAVALYFPLQEYKNFQHSHEMATNLTQKIRSL